MSKDKSNTAFPAGGDAWSNGTLGLTKREYFSAMALQGLISSGQMGLSDGSWTYQNLYSNIAVEYADALIKELEK